MAELDNKRRLLSSRWMSWYRDPVLIVAFGVVLGLDQITKAVIRQNLALGESIPREGTFRITHTYNTGSAFGLFPDQTLFLIIASFVGIAILLLVYRNATFPSFLLRLSLSMQLGGAVGNLVDRVRVGRVTDFVELGFWPVFNVADASIVIGITILGWLFFFTRREERGSSEVVVQRESEVGEISAAPFSPAQYGSQVQQERESEAWSREGMESVLENLPGPNPSGHGTCPACNSAMYLEDDAWRCPSCSFWEGYEHGESG